MCIQHNSRSVDGRVLGSWPLDAGSSNAVPPHERAQMALVEDLKQGRRGRKTTVPTGISADRRYSSDRNRRQDTKNQTATAASQTDAARNVLPLDTAL